MALMSRLFHGDPHLDACLRLDSAHITPGASGDHVAKIHTAVSRIDGYRISFDEIVEKRYGSTTAAAILAYKQKRRIINYHYQTQADNIVGKMTIAALDKEVACLETRPCVNDPRFWSTS